MKSKTVTAVFDAPPNKVFEYMSDIRNLSEWATEFARELIEEDGTYKIRNNLGEFLFEIRANAATGIIDMFAGPSAEQMAVFPTRVVEMPDGRSAYSFTMFKGLEMSDELFDSQHESLKREFANIERLLAEA